jgi:cytosine/adenosine deaminase-related metal-dependent hydrolase
MGYLLMGGAHMGTSRDLREGLAMPTTYPARILRLPAYRLEPGCRADLVVCDAAAPEEIVAALEPPRLVVRRGRVPVEHRRAAEEPWRRP